MSLTVTIPEDLADELTRAARVEVKSPEQVAISAIRKNLYTSAKLTETLAPIREAFRRSGITEDEAVELFEAEKHAMRRESQNAMRTMNGSST